MFGNNGLNQLTWDQQTVTDQHIQSDLPAFSWFLVHCKPNSEQIALRNIENQEVRAFLPIQKLTRRKGNTFKMQLRPLFPGYLFVHIDPQAGHWRKINNTRGVARIVRLGPDPCPVPPAIMTQLIERCDAAGIFQPSARLTAGEEAQITQGPFAGSIARIIEIEPNHRVHLLLDIMGQTSNLTIDASALMPGR